jgi:hypothetical protein
MNTTLSDVKEQNILGGCKHAARSRSDTTRHVRVADVQVMLLS